MSEAAVLDQPVLHEEHEPRRHPMLTMTWVGVFLFCAAYFFRPADFIAALTPIPIAKITGAFGAIALLTAIIIERVQLSRESKVMLLFLAYQVICIPFSRWQGGSFNLIIIGFSKMLLIAIAAITCLINFKRLRRLILVQVSAMLFLCIMALGQGKVGGRMYGAGYLFGDPNDFALNLCIVTPLAVALMVSAKRVVGKIFWLGTAALFLYGIISSGSRGGFLALLALTATMTMKFAKGIGARVGILFLAFLVVTGAVVSVGSTEFLDRMSTIVNPDSDPNGSAQARREILIESLKTTAKNPVFGIGPGQFENYGGAWHQTHNTYTQLSAESGIPSLLIFLYLMRLLFGNVRKAQRTADPKEAFLAKGIYCATAAYMVGGFFLSTAYQFYPYLLMAYAAAAAKIAKVQEEQPLADTKLFDPDLIEQPVKVWE